MHQRALGKSGIQVSEVGMGCNRLGEEQQPDEFWVDLVKAAADLGVTVFDTSESYKWGRSEEMLGQALGNRDDVLIASKVSRDREQGQVGFAAERVQQAAEASLRRLQRDCIDIYQLHSPPREALENDDWAEGMRRLQEQGKIRLRAVAVRTVDDGLWLIEQGMVDVLQITYNIFETAVAEELLPAAEAAGVGLLGRMPLARGVLTGKFRAEDGIPNENRASLDGERAQQRLTNVDDLRPLGNGYPGGLTRLAHHFCLSSPAISAIIPGARNLAQLQDNVAASNGIGLPPEMLTRIQHLQARW